MNIILGLTGSVAASLAPKLVKRLLWMGKVVVIPTEKAKHFYEASDLEKLKSESDGRLSVFDDESEWHLWSKKGDPVQHIDLRKWAHVMVIAPLTANTLAKIAYGLCDNLLTSIVRAWDYEKPLILAPAMNTYMWEHPLTDAHLSVVRGLARPRYDPMDARTKSLLLLAMRATRGRPLTVTVVDPASKILACGDAGKGAMADIDAIAEAITSATRWRWPLAPPHFCNDFGLGLPIGNHPGAFGFSRRHDVHTGVDLYCSENTVVEAMERGIVVKIEPFTGRKVIINGEPSTWWNDTSVILVEGASGIVGYGEVIPLDGLKVGDEVKQGDAIARVTPVLPEGKLRPDIPGHSRSMLHVELYSELLDSSRGVWEVWKLGDPKPEKLLDPTSRLMEAKPAVVPCLRK